MGARQGVLFGTASAVEAVDAGPGSAPDLAGWLRAFDGFGRPTLETRTRSSDGAVEVPTFVNEFWTARQRAASSLHEVSYRACFKPALPAFFIERLTEPGEVVHDPFLGRGTTAVEAALRGRIPHGCDVNPLSRVLCEPRLAPPRLDEVTARLDELDLSGPVDAPDELLTFYHPETLREIAALRARLLAGEAAGTLDPVDRFIRMVAVNRLTGHSPGFLSVYTLPPNQAVSVGAQRKINEKRGQVPPRREVRALIARKARSLLSGVDEAARAALAGVAAGARILTAPGAATPAIPDASVALVVTSPPFLDVVQYAADNWLRCWFCGIDPTAVPITHARRIADWEEAMTAVMRELRRVLRPGGHVAFEVGEVRAGKVRLEEHVLSCARAAGLAPVCVLIHDQRFTKTANCWGIDNNRHGTNSNRVAVLRREA
jgi:hypothetical protein